ncbi:MAG: hypothetical protein QG647_217 [Patescibacteria group bacterium]|nr:hypothetical protein [Patescibacteria group bacterium]
MPSSKVFNVQPIGNVTITKKRGIKRISLRVLANGTITVTMPPYVPYVIGQQFVKSHTEWINKRSQSIHNLILYNQMPVGKTYRLRITKGSTTKARLIKDSIALSYNTTLNDPLVLKSTKLAVKRAIKKESEQLLPNQTAVLAKRFGYNYSQVVVRPMKTRWGSCSSKQIIALNTYLMMLPWPIINYVIIHELAHTKHMNHSKQFWGAVAQMEPNYKDLKKQLKTLQPQVHSFYI